VPNTEATRHTRSTQPAWMVVPLPDSSKKETFPRMAYFRAGSRISKSGGGGRSDPGRASGSKRLAPVRSGGGKGVFFSFAQGPLFAGLGPLRGPIKRQKRLPRYVYRFPTTGWTERGGMKRQNRIPERGPWTGAGALTAEMKVRIVASAGSWPSREISGIGLLRPDPRTAKPFWQKKTTNGRLPRWALRPVNQIAQISRAPAWRDHLQRGPSSDARRPKGTGQRRRALYRGRTCGSLVKPFSVESTALARSLTPKFRDAPNNAARPAAGRGSKWYPGHSPGTLMT